MMLQMLWINSMGHPKFQFTGLVPCGYFTPFSICPKSYAGIWVEYKANALIYPLASCYGLQTIHRDNTALGKGHLEGRCIFEGPGILLRSAQIGWIRF